MPSLKAYFLYQSACVDNSTCKDPRHRESSHVLSPKPKLLYFCAHTASVDHSIPDVGNLHLLFYKNFSFYNRVIVLLVCLFHFIPEVGNYHMCLHHAFLIYVIEFLSNFFFFPTSYSLSDFVRLGTNIILRIFCFRLITSLEVSLKSPTSGIFPITFFFN